MFRTRRRTHISGTFIALLGLILALYGAVLQAEALCITNGCTLFSDVTIMGISPWWLAVAAFGIIALLCMGGRTQAALWCSTLLLLGDMLFLGIMAFSLPCVPCLLVACIILFLYRSLTDPQDRSPWVRTVPTFFWLAIFSPSLVNAGTELAGGWRIHGEQQAQLQVYFSPSCPACKETVLALSQSNPAHVAYYPVAEEHTDLIRLRIMQDELAAGRTLYAAFRTAISDTTPLDTPLSMTGYLSLQWKVLQNKSRLARMGITRIPALITSGKPAGLDAATQDVLSAISNSTTYAGCNDTITADCDDQATPAQPTPLQWDDTVLPFTIETP